MKLSDYVIDMVARTGVKHVFMLPGGGCMHLVDSLGSHPKLTFICNLHEQATAIATDAYGQFTNNLGVALVTTGPGGTNTLTGVAAAWLDSTPCLFISGQVKRADMKGNSGVRQKGFQEIDIVRMVEPITKYAVTVTDPSTIRYHVEKALYLARNGRPGPVWIDIPLDVQAANVDEAAMRAFDPSEVAPPDTAHAVRLAATQVLGLLKTAKRPALLVGNGVRLDRALESFNALLEVLKVPLLTTWKALDFVADDHPLYVGRPGGVGQRGANFTQQNSDLIIIIGARLDFGQTAYVHANFARGARKVVVDIDAAEIGKLQMNVDVPVVAGAGAFMEALRETIRTSDSLPDYSSWLAQAHAWVKKYPVCLPEYRNITDGVSNYVLIEELSKVMRPDDLLIPGSSGACSETTMQAFRCKDGQRVFNSEGLGPMGFGIPAAIGGCIASGGRKTICLDGDGGFVMNIQELEVVRRLKLPIKFFILDNNGYGSIRQSQNVYFKGRLVASEPSSGLTLPDMTKVAESYGIESCVIANHDELAAGVAAVLNHDRPVICVVKITPSQATAPRVASGQRSDGSMYSKPMEDMAPLLDRAEFLENMIVSPVEE
ncbi:MAG TPA: thiamine pyrophosphate-binding protein [Lacunisphaera sp.]|jgi:acetolactate synthase-1/2/3 large subunit